jgi:hypothetical protein
MPPNGVSIGRLVDAAAAPPEVVLSRFLRELSPRRTVRVANPAQAEPGKVRVHTRSQWTQGYTETRQLAEADTVRPVAMYLARRFPGSKLERFTLVAADFDVSRASVDEVEEHAAHLVRLAEACGIPAVVSESGPSGGLHAWMACPEGVAPETVRRLARAAAELWATFDGTPLYNPVSGAMRPPGAAHRHGGHARLRSHSLADAVALLKQGVSAAAFEELAAAVEALAAAAGGRRHEDDDEHQDHGPHAGRRVPRSITHNERGHRRPLVRPVTTDQNGRVRLDTARVPLDAAAAAAVHRQLADEEQHSDHAHYVLRLLAAAGYGYQDAAALAPQAPGLEYLRTERAPGGRRERPADQRTALLGRLWWLAVQDAARRPAGRPEGDRGAYAQLAVEVAHLLDRAETAGPARWARQSGPADLACLRAIAWLMLVSGSAAVSAPCRRIGVLMGYHHSTAALAMARLVKDGWLMWKAEAVEGTRTAGRLAIAAMHECTDDEHHMCALYTLADEATGEIITADEAGSDRSRNGAAPPPSRTLLPRLSYLLTHHQGDVWDRLGHHCARTYEAIQEGLRTPYELAQRTHYTDTTTAAHIEDLRTVGLITVAYGSSGLRVAPSGRTLWQAAEAASPGLAGRIATLAVRAIVAAYVADWWHAEEAWCRTPRDAKRRRGRRAAPDQQLIPARDHAYGIDPRAYPRKGPDNTGAADHQRARILAATRVDAESLRAHARQLARAGALVDPGTLTTQATQRHAA